MSVRRVIALLACLLAPVGIQTASAAADPAPNLPTGPILQPGDPNWPNEWGSVGPNYVGDGGWELWGRMPGKCLDTGGTPSNPADYNTDRPAGGLPCNTPDAVDPEGAAGINTTGAWAQGNVGRDDVLVAYIEGGVNYSSNSIRDALNNVYLNKGELPYPQKRDGSDLGRHDYDGNGRFDIRDYQDDPRVNPDCAGNPDDSVKFAEGTTRTCINGGQHEYIHKVNINGPKTAYLSPDDLVAVFGKCRITDGRVANCPNDGRFDNDGNGYPNDVSGWNAYHNTNDPQTDNLDYDHASGLMSDIAGQMNNNFSGMGGCPQCRVIPIKSGAESIGKADGLAPAITYAVDIGADAVSSVVVSYAYSSALREAVAYAVKKNVLMSMDSNDFDSMDHTDGHLFDDVFPGNGLVRAKDGSGKVQTYRGRGTVTSYGTHSIFSGNSATTSGATPFQAAFLAMVQSAARNAVDQSLYPRELTVNEVKQVLINTMSPIVPETDYPQIPKQWPGNPDSKTDATHTNWSTQYGYGRPNIGKATKLVMDGKVPPTARLTSPGWYRYVDPSRQKSVQVKGSVQPSAWGSQGVAWTLEWAFGADPKDSDFKTISTGKSGKSGVLGTISTKALAAYAKKTPGVTLPPKGPEQYTVSVRLRARDGNGLKGEDRRSFGARTDRGLAPGYPKSIGTEMSAAPTFADLQGRGRLDLVFGTYDGVVNAIGPDGKQAKNFPLKTRQLRYVDSNLPQGFPSEAYRSVRALRETRDPISGIAIGDLEGRGDQSIVATTFSGWTYAWSATTGKLRSGFPAKPDPQYNSLPSPTPSAQSPGQPEGPGSRLPIRGNWSAPVLANLTGNGKLSILTTSFDGHLYAWQPNGQAVPGWPVEVKLPASQANAIEAGKYVRDPKLIQPPAVGDVLGTGTDQVFLPSFECDKKTGAVFLYGIQSDGNDHAGGAFMPGWPVKSGGMAGCYQESIDFVQEGGNGATIADVDGSGTQRIAFTAAGGFPQIINADGSIFKNLSGSCKTTTCKGIPPYYLPDGMVIGLSGQSAFGDMTGNGKLNYAQSVAGGTSLMQAFDADGTALLAHVYDSVWDPVSGAQLPDFPTDQDGFAFYSSPLITGLGSGKSRSMISSNDSYWIHARGPDGKEAPGFPKWTGQWTGFGGAVGDPKANGSQYLAYGTREGQLFLWKVGGKAERNDQWWKYRHDEHNSGRFGNDTRPPAGAAVKIRRTGSKAVLTWKAAGDNGVSNGKVRTLQIYRSKKAVTVAGLGKAKRLKAGIAAPGRTQRLTVKLGKKKTAWIAIRTRDRAGNWSPLTRVKIKKYNAGPTIRKCKKKFKKNRKKRVRCISRAKRG
ncbi:MAG: S8 family serine peptidase [Solirubrobacterales bacterium]|nr:S8 family serine peptidase [Solirubrobacterales bacterium]